MDRRRAPWLPSALVALAGCGADPDLAPPDDAGADDVVAYDRVAPTPRPPDARAPDVTAPDVTAPDVTAPDVTASDAEALDAAADVTTARDVMDAAPDAPRDAGADAPRDAGADAQPDAGPAGVAPRGAVTGEVAARDGANALTVTAGSERVLRVDARPDEHVHFMLRFAPAGAPVVLRVERWDGAAPRALGATDGGSGLRTLAVFDPRGTRTFWARVRSTAALASATLTVTRTPFADGARCASDCARLLQLPLPNDPRVDGYATDGATVFRYQFGRRDLVMFVRHAGQAMARMGAMPFVPQDLSQWDGATPGTDTGNLRHASHQRGKDVDLSLYGADGAAPWRSYCTVRAVSGGRECTPGTVRGFAPLPNVRMFADFFATGRVTMCFLDSALVAQVQPAARGAMLAPSVAAQFSDGTHLQHWPNHDNHIHVRVSEGPTSGAGLVWEPFEAP